MSFDNTGGLGKSSLTGYEVALLAKAHELLSRFGLQYDIVTAYGTGTLPASPALWFKASDDLDAEKKAKLAELTGLSCFNKDQSTGLPQRWKNQWAVEGTNQEIFEAVEQALSHPKTPKPKIVGL